MSVGPGDTGRQAVDTLVRVGEDLHEEFQQKRRVLTFEEYFRLVAEQPRCHLRDSSMYLRDTFDHFGTYEVRRARGTLRRFRLFDCEFAAGRDRLAGHETVQNAIYRVLNGFVNQGRPNKLILLHGPNGSAKSTCVAAIARALEHYSRLEEGALYRFNWVFPSGTHSKGGIGFKSDSRDMRLESFAHLPEELIDARLPDELRDHPLLLIPRSRRAELVEDLAAAHGARRTLPDSLKYGALSHRNREIFEALLSLYHGDYHGVLRHVQVERFFLSRRYRTGLIVVEPKLSVDARTQQITVDRSIEALPPALQTTALFRYSGELVDANRGIIEFSDLLKRPLESFKYLINTVELGRVGLDNAILYLDEVFIGSSNDLHLQAFREMPDFPSFKGRIELVRVGYLLDQQAEAEIYTGQLASHDVHVAPHAIEVAALWAVLTRLQKPTSTGHPDLIRTPIDRLSVLDKALLYSPGTLPPGVEGETSQLLRAAVKRLTEENEHTDSYEGHEGASPREIRMALLNAAQDNRRGFLSPLAVLDELEELSRMQDVYPYLRRAAKPGGYADAGMALQHVREYYFSRLQDDVWSAVGLIPPGQIDKMLVAYVDHVGYWIKGEKVKNPITGALADADESLMEETEAYLGIDDPQAFRRDVMARIASWAMAHTDRRPVLGEIFAKEKQQIIQGLFDERRKALTDGLEDVIELLGKRVELLSESRRTAALSTLGRLLELGYTDASAEEAIRHYLQEQPS
ncbi:MAG: serine protein kinase PrkA [bacterium]